MCSQQFVYLWWFQNYYLDSIQSYAYSDCKNTLLMLSNWYTYSDLKITPWIPTTHTPTVI